MGRSWNIPSMDCELGKSEWLGKGKPEEMSHKSNLNFHEGATQGVSLSSPACLSTHTVVFFPPNKHYLFRYVLSENPFLQSQRARALSLIIGLVARIWCFPNQRLGTQALLQVTAGQSWRLSSVQFSSSIMSTLCNSMDCSTPGFPVHHQLLELT